METTVDSLQDVFCCFALVYCKWASGFFSNLCSFGVLMLFIGQRQKWLQQFLELPIGRPHGLVCGYHRKCTSYTEAVRLTV